MSRAFWAGRRVLVTGHTGFKGGWLALWLADMGAEVHGYALAPSTEPSFFNTTNVASRLASSRLGDVRDRADVAATIAATRPEVIFHLAAQPLVRESYVTPVETFAVNVMGTAHVLEAARATPGVDAIVSVTTDKCYENREWLWPYREDEALGGHDPYSSSKACAEHVTAAYRRSFLAEAGIAVATARAGNVVGGGDWATDRLIPDFLRAIDADQPLVVRSPEAVRPWQHVLEPLAGYLRLAERMTAAREAFAEAWNFGPRDGDVRPVRWIVDRLCRRAPGAAWMLAGEPGAHEAHLLKLDSSKAIARLDWRPRWSLGDALDRTLEWHQAWRGGRAMAEVSLEQMRAYEGTTAE